MNIRIQDIAPEFLRKDKNGYALAMAIRAGLAYAVEKIENGTAVMTDVDSMPEWRLDELAQEYNALYDTTADAAMKRQWLKNAIADYRIMGTAEAVRKYLTVVLEDVVVEEAADYGGDPFHFRVTGEGDFTDVQAEWLQGAVEKAKNLRSVFDGLSRGARDIVTVSETVEAIAFTVPLLYEDGFCGLETVENGQ